MDLKTKPSLPWYVRFSITIALIFIPDPWKSRLQTILNAYNSLPESEAAAAHDHVISVLSQHCDAAGCPLETVKP